MHPNQNESIQDTVTEAATPASGEQVPVTSGSTTEGDSLQPNSCGTPNRNCPSAKMVIPEAGDRPAAEASVTSSTQESAVPSSPSGLSQGCFGSRSLEQVRRLQSELQETAPRTYTILVSVGWDVTRLSETDFCHLVGVFFKETQPRMVQGISDRGVIDAEDVVQNLFFTILRANKRGRRKALDFLMTEHRRSCRAKAALRQQTRRSSRQIPLCDHIKDTVGVPDRELELHWIYEELEVALSRLKPNHRAVLELQYLRGWSQAEVGRALGISTAAVKSLSSRAREEALISSLRGRRSGGDKRNQKSI